MPDLTVQLNHILPELEREAVFNQKISEMSIVIDQKSKHSVSVSDTPGAAIVETNSTLQIFY